MSREVRLALCDLASDWDPEDNYFTRALRRHGYRLTLVHSPEENPDFVLCGTFGRDFLKYSCPRIQFSGEDSWPDLNLYDYAIGFPRLEFEGRYLRWPLYALQDNWPLALNKHKTPDETLLSKKKFCCFVVSNDFCTARNNFMELLNEKLPVESGGRYRNNIGGPVADKLAFQSEFRLAAAYENSATPGYITEKLTDAFAAATVPIYWGDPGVAAEFNPAAFLNAADYDTPEQLADAAVALYRDDARWLQMVKEPILKPDSIANKYVDDAGCFAFLDEIFTKHPGELRRNQSCWGSIYEGDLRAAYTLLEDAARPKPFAERLKRLLRGE